MSTSTWFRTFKHKHRVSRALRELETRSSQAAPHGLKSKLIVSLTSYPARFGTLAQTLRSLLLQTTQADETILWIGHDALEQLPPEVLECKDLGLTIKTTKDIRAYTKLIPALNAYPDAYIVTADDDLYYDKDWLKSLVDAHHKSGVSVICHRAHKVLITERDILAPYNDWAHNTDQADHSHLIFPTGVCGVFYAPNSFDPRVLDQDLFQSLCPYADDVWFYWMHRMTGGCAEKIGGKRRILEWDLQPLTDLRAYNVLQNGNDTQIKALTQHFGMPQ